MTDSILHFETYPSSIYLNNSLPWTSFIQPEQRQSSGRCMKTLLSVPQLHTASSRPCGETPGICQGQGLLGIGWTSQFSSSNWWTSSAGRLQPEGQIRGGTFCGRRSVFCSAHRDIYYGLRVYRLQRSWRCPLRECLIVGIPYLSRLGTMLKS